MKNLYQLDAKAYKEGYIILNLLPQYSKSKIPENIWQFIKKNMDLNYEVSLNDLSKGQLLDDTNNLLAIIYKTYLATDDEKKVINAKEKFILRQKDIEARKKYNPDNLF